MEVEARRRVLSDAHDGAQLYDLLQPIINDPSGASSGSNERYRLTRRGEPSAMRFSAETSSSRSRAT